MATRGVRPDDELLDPARRVAADRSPYDVMVAVEELARKRVDHVTEGTGESHAWVEVWLGDW